VSADELHRVETFDGRHIVHAKMLSVENPLMCKSRIRARNPPRTAIFFQWLLDCRHRSNKTNFRTVDTAFRPVISTRALSAPRFLPEPVVRNLAPLSFDVGPFSLAFAPCAAAAE
jgi:hypothetical protein